MQMRTELGVLALVSALTLGLTGCGGESTPTEIVASGELPFSTLTVSPVSAQRERIWDGVIEAVNQATLSRIMPSGTLNEERPMQYSMISESADLPVEERPVMTLSPSTLNRRSRRWPSWL